MCIRDSYYTVRPHKFDFPLPNSHIHKNAAPQGTAFLSALRPPSARAGCGRGTLFFVVHVWFPAHTNAPRPPRRGRRPALTVSTGPSYGLGPTPARRGITAGIMAAHPPCRGRRPRRPAVTVTASPTAFRRPPPGRGITSRYIMRHAVRFPPAVGVGVLDDPFLRPLPAPRCRTGCGRRSRPQRGDPRRGSPL